MRLQAGIELGENGSCKSRAQIVLFSNTFLGRNTRSYRGLNWCRYDSPAKKSGPEGKAGPLVGLDAIRGLHFPVWVLINHKRWLTPPRLLGQEFR